MKLLGLNSPEIFIILVILLSILGPKRVEKGFLLFKKLLKFLLSKDKDQSSANSNVKQEEAEALVTEERIVFLEWWASLEAVPVINKLRSDLELIRKEELQKALSRMGPDFSARERKVVEALTKGIINKILHTPVTKLRSPQSREERQVSLKIVEKLFSLVEEDKNN